MQGQDQLLALRRAGRIPADGVYIEVCRKRGVFPRSQQEADGERMRLTIAPEEPVDRLDLRCVIGLEVVVLAYPDAPAAGAVHAVCEACVAAGAKVVIGLQFHDEAEPTRLFTHGAP